MRIRARCLPTDMHIVGAQASFTREHLRVPLHMSSGPIYELTLAHVSVETEGTDGRRARGRGECYLSDLWAWPSAIIDHPQRDAAMRRLTDGIVAALPGVLPDWGHPVELGMALHDTQSGLAADAAAEPALPEPYPALAVSVCAAAFDAALHDAYGLLHGCSSYDVLGPAYLSGDLGRFLGDGGAGVTLEQALALQYTPRVPGCVLVGPGDPLMPEDVTSPVGDGLPECAVEWIERGGFHAVKVKLAAHAPREDAAWAVKVYHTLCAVYRGEAEPWISLDPNEGYTTVEEVVALLHYLEELDPAAYRALRYIEQPVPRAQSQTLDLSPVHVRKSVLADEGITGLEQLAGLMRAGWSGLVLKTCKGHTLGLLLAAWSHLHNHPYSLQDLTNPALAALHSLGLAARLHAINGIELNSPQFTPAANAETARRHPGAFTVSGGMHDASTLTGPGLGYGSEDK